MALPPPYRRRATWQGFEDFHLKARKEDVRLPGREDLDSHGARPVHLIFTMTKWVWTSRLSMKNSLSSPEGQVRNPDLAVSSLYKEGIELNLSVNEVDHTFFEKYHAV